ncbi:MAG: hypothetical protein LBH84_09195, partial [Prevotellaceae bacterium]|nr:hypothetical protein [Prevotellaceae bacterium]
MTLKDYIDHCSWDELKATRGVKEYMQRSLADLKRLEPKYTDETALYTIHFSENNKDEGDPYEKKIVRHYAEFVQHCAFVQKTGCERTVGVFESVWDEMLPLEVVFAEGQTLTGSEVVASVIWGLTRMGATSEECEKAWKADKTEQQSETVIFSVAPESHELMFNATAEKITVDWGDGKTDEYMPPEKYQISHLYVDDTARTARIYAKRLTYFDCGYNHLTALDVSRCKALTELKCRNTRLSVLDVSHNPALVKLDCGFNELSALDVSHNPALVKLDCCSNELSALDVSHNPALVKLNCGSNELSALDVSHNPALVELSCDINELSVLDVSHNPALVELNCDYNQLSVLDVSKNVELIELNCGDNQLSVLDVSNNSALTDLWCDGNQLNVLNVSNNTKLTDLWCWKNQLSVLDVSYNPALESLKCDSNQISVLDISKNMELIALN